LERLFEALFTQWPQRLIMSRREPGSHDDELDHSLPRPAVRVRMADVGRAERRDGRWQQMIGNSFGGA